MHVIPTVQEGFSSLRLIFNTYNNNDCSGACLVAGTQTMVTGIQQIKVYCRFTNKKLKGTSTKCTYCFGNEYQRSAGLINI